MSIYVSINGIIDLKILYLGEDKMTLYKEFCELNTKYYLDNKDIEKDFSLSKEQINHFFDMAEKRSVVEDFNNMDEMRSHHSMSLLYLGVLINSKLNLNMKIRIANESFDFNYFWSILCFYHDLGYEAENHNSFHFKMNQKNGNNFRYSFFTSDICKDFSLTFKYPQFFNKSIIFLAKFKSPFLVSPHNRFNTNFIKLEEKDFEEIDKIDNIKIMFNNNLTEIRRSFFSEKEVSSYYKFRLAEFGVFDHGIVGGYIFFDSIMKCYFKSYKARDDADDSQLSFFKNYKHFCVEQIPMFAYIADCIVSHNIFFSSNETKELYEEYSLLSLDKKKRISLRNNPVLFILELLDTIDPIKFFSKPGYGYEVIEILKSFNWKFENEKVIIISLSEINIFSIFEYENYVNHINSIETWLDVSIIRNKNAIKIIINGK